MSENNNGRGRGPRSPNPFEFRFNPESLDQILDPGYKRVAQAGIPKSDLYSEIKPKCTLASLELNPDLRKEVQEIIEDRAYSTALKQEGLVPRKLLMLEGPPGCGKTSIAHGMAEAMKMPLYLVSTGQLISKYVGESEKFVEKIFKFSAEHEVLLLIDEFDSFGLERHGNIYEQRLVNTFLVNMEMNPPKGMVVACTNYAQHIDAAIMRRFDSVLEVPQVSYKGLIKIAESVLQGRFKISPADCVREGITPSGTVRAAKNRLRSAVIEREQARACAS
jgi:SpoVK/Ycf46/Vps4 family AAA+-type ATPase